MTRSTASYRANKLKYGFYFKAGNFPAFGVEQMMDLLAETLEAMSIELYYAAFDCHDIAAHFEMLALARAIGGMAARLRSGAV